jgi:hypothetical protein
MRSVAVQQLALQVRQRADLSGQQNAFGSNSGGNITDTEMLAMLNASYAELWDILTEKFGENYSFNTYNLPIAQGTYDYQLPFDFFKLLGVDLALDNTLQNWSQIKPYTLKDRNLFSYPLQPYLAYPGWQNIRYMVQGQIIDFQPKLGPFPGNVRVWYIPACPTLCASLPVAWASSTATAQNALVYASVTVNGETQNFVFLALNSGTTGGSAPSWNVPGTTSDNGIFWAAQAPLSLYATTADGVDGWEDYIVLDSAIKSLAKQQRPADVFEAQKQALMARINRAAKDRIAGDPTVISGGFGALEGGPSYGGYFNGFGFGGGW